LATFLHQVLYDTDNIVCIESHYCSSEQHQHLVESSQFYPNSLESLTTSGTIDYFEAVDGSRAAEALVTSILINGRSQYVDPRSNENSTSPFERLFIDPTNTEYRLRLINAGSTFALKFSIDDHILQVIASDGIPFDRTVLADEVIIGLGERYDVLIHVNTSSNHNACKNRYDLIRSSDSIEV
jgi:FtsP/CotA-like multicopper oxidase with cupredoxin domain